MAGTLDLENVLLAACDASRLVALARTARALRLGEAARCEILYVDAGAAAGSPRDAIHEAARALVGNATSSLDVQGSKVSGTDLIAAIQARALSHRPELVIVDRDAVRRGGLLSRWLPSDASRIVDAAATSLLLTRGESAGGYRRPLVGVGLNPSAALALTKRLMAGDAGRIDVVHAYDAPNEMLYRGRHMRRIAPSGLHAYLRACRKRARSDARAAARAVPTGETRVRICVRRGPPREVILGEAHRRRTDLIAVGLDVEHATGRLLFGSVAEDVIASSPCDVLLAVACQI